MNRIKLAFVASVLGAVFFLACGKNSTAPTPPAPGNINIRLSAATLSFGEVIVGDRKDSTLVVENLSNSNGSLAGNLSVSGPNFSIAGDATFNVSPGQTKSFVIRFSPTSTGAFSGSIAITHNANNQTSPASITLNGAGDDKAAAIKTLIQSGWQAFAAKDYANAEARFGQAIPLAQLSVIYDSLHAEALSGRGWAKAYRRNFFPAKNDFTESLTHAKRGVRTDLSAKAGLALVHHALNEFAAAIPRALEVVNSSPNYAFEHDAKVTFKRLRLLLAQSYYTLGDFPKAAEQLDILDPPGRPHSTDPVILLQQIQDWWGKI